MLDWLNRLFDWIFQFVPQFMIVSPAEEAVRVTCIPFVYKSCKTKKFGWYVYWPLFQTFEKRIIKPQILLVELSYIKEGGKPVESMWAVQYWIQNIYKAIYEIEDVDERMAAHLSKAVIKHNDVAEILKDLRDAIAGFGIYIQDVFPIQIVPIHAHKVYLDNVAQKVGRIIG